MTIEIGQQLPDATLQAFKDGPVPMTTAQIFGGKRVVLFSVPGAFTPTCSARHLPSYIEHFDAFKKRGVEVACIAVNDVFVMEAWAKTQGAPDDLLMLADGNGAFTKALGLEMDATGYGMGMRGKRFALYADDGVVKALNVEAPGEYKVSSAEAMLEAIA